MADDVSGWVHRGIQHKAIGAAGDWMRHVSGAGPIAKQSWLQRRKFRDAAVTEIVEQSLIMQPLGADQAKA